MAKTEYEIYMDFEKARLAAEELLEIARAVGNLSQDDMQVARNQIQANWKGENAEAYLRKYEIVQHKIQQTAETIIDIERTVMQIADNTYKAEMAAIEIASN